MTRLLKAEALRLRTTRAYWLLAAGALAVVAGATAAIAGATSFPAGTSAARSTMAIAGLAQAVTLIAGVLSVTSDFRHKTITCAILITPARTPLLAARLITMAAAGLAFGLLTASIAAATTLPLLGAIIGGGAIAGALFAAIGVGAGAIVRNQAGAIVAVLALLYVAEPLLEFVPHLGTAVQLYGLGGLSSAATRTTGLPGTTHLLGQPASILVLAGYATAILLAAAAVLRRRDITP
jgi:ABC-2 type transport system permease protein